MAADKEREGVLARSREEEEEEEVERGSVTRTKRRLRGERRGERYTRNHRRRVGSRWGR